MNRIDLNAGAQHSFVTSMAHDSAYMGGVGSGKTWAALVKLLKAAQQPKVPGEKPPRAVLLSVSVPVVRDIAEGPMDKLLEATGVKAKYKVNDRKYVLESGGEVWFRGLDEPKRLRGIECVAYGIDEGRNFKDKEGWDIMTGRLRQGVNLETSGVWQPGHNYYHQGFVTSTPNGYDWMYDLFHPESTSDNKIVGAEWYNASTMDNARNLPSDYVEHLKAKWKGRFYEQEVLGHFIGVVSGSVFPEFAPSRHTAELEYNPDLPLYSFWDFGIGDAGVCIFAQLEWREHFGAGVIHRIPYLYVLDAIEMKDSTVSDWAKAYFKWCTANAGGREPLRSWGDPAGGQRNNVTGTSTLRELRNLGVRVKPAPRKAVDEGLIIIQNLLEGDQLIINRKAERVIKAVQTYRWKVDDNGQRLSDKPVHDWTSHVCDALRYGAVGLIGMSRRYELQPAQEAQRGTMGYIMDQLNNQDKELVQMGSSPELRIDWHPDAPAPLGDLL